MAQAIRTKDIVLIHEGDTTVKVRRPAMPHPMTRYGTFRRYKRAHFMVENDRTQEVRVHFRLFEDKGMLADLIRRAASNKSGVAVRGPARATRGGGVRVDYDGKWNLIAAAANTKGGKAMDGPLTVRVKLLERPEPFEPLCRHCERPAVEHEFVAGGFHNVIYGTQDNAWWCVPGPAHCQICAAAPGRSCEHDCPNRKERGGSW